MATGTVADYLKVQTDKFDKAIPIYLTNEIPLLKLMNKGKTVGFDSEKSFIIPFQYQQEEGSAWTTENADTPNPLLPKYEQMSLGWKKMAGTVQFSEETLELKGKKTFVNAWSRGSAGLLRTHKSDLDTALHGRGTGSLAHATGAATGQVVPVATTKYLRPGMVLDGYDASDNQDADGIVISSIDSDTTFTCVGAVTSVDANTVFFKEGSWITSLDKAAMGIDGIIDNAGTFQNLDRATYPFMNAKVVDGATPGTPEALTLARMRTALDAVKKGSYDKLPSAIYTSIGVYNAYTDLLISMNQPVETMPDKAGFPGGAKFHYGNTVLPVIASSKAVDNTMFMISKPTLFKYYGTMGWANRGGGILQKVTDKLAYQAVHRMWVNFGTTYPEANARLNDIIEA